MTQGTASGPTAEASRQELKSQPLPPKDSLAGVHGVSSAELEELERSWPEGMPLAAIVEFLLSRGVQMTEGTFRKYVQLGLLPRSRRVGRKGKHQGSHGLYPVDSAARVIEIKTLMEAGLTLEEIQRSALAVGAEVDVLRRTAEDIISRLEQALAELDDRPPLPVAQSSDSEGEGAASSTSSSSESVSSSESAFSASQPDIISDSRGQKSEEAPTIYVKRPKRTRELVESLVQIRTLTEQLVRAMEIATVEICASAVGPPEPGMSQKPPGTGERGQGLARSWTSSPGRPPYPHQSAAWNQRPTSVRTQTGGDRTSTQTSVALIRKAAKRHEEHEE